MSDGGNSEKRENLKRHLPFIDDMLSKVTSTKYEAKWKRLKEFIASDKM